MKTELLISFVLAITALGLFFLSFEKKKPPLSTILLVVTLCSVGSVGRIIFNFIPQVQPVTAIVIISGLCLGWQGGFLTGALSALVSNMVLGQGPWTPWQMLAWGLIGILAGLLAKTKISNHLSLLCIFAFFSGLLFSLIMDVYTVASLGSATTLAMTLSVFVTGLLFNISHAVGNVIFLLLLYPMMKKKLTRIHQKYAQS